MDQPTQTVSTSYGAVGADVKPQRLRRGQIKTAVRAFGVVVPDVLSKRPLEMAPPEDQDVI